ncbi:hypothetical protein [Escherichia coli]|uniref:hypothetical protein n=1 Tax=Escherichia coli TaxID=562 RepID=UPI001E38C406|nr:hypothetical protein [Escherichia coli]
MAKAWDIEPSIFAGMIEEDVGLKIRYIAMQILTAIDIAAPVDTGRFRNNNLVLRDPLIISPKRNHV